MTNETRKRIEAYKKALPEMKERVMAVAILLVMSISMMISASFAWITLSRSPEMTGMQTTVAANGNLEIALAQGSTSETVVAPGESQIGDSSAAEDQSIVEANATWGNLVNVSDPTYGVSQIALRPALLSDYNRKKYPLNGASYGGDGRVVATNDRYEFASYTKVDGKDEYYFAAGDKVNYGVRAISSVGYSNITGNAKIDTYQQTTVGYYQEAQKKYGAIVSDGKDAYVLDEASGVTCISALEGLVTVFAQDKINAMGYGPSGATTTSCSPYLWYVYQMMLLLEDVLEEEGKALLTMANWQAYVHSGDDKIETTFLTVDDLLRASDATLKEKGVVITTLANYKSNVADLKKCINGIKPMADNCQDPEAPLEEYYWDDIDEYVNLLVHVNSATINGRRLDTINGVGAAMDVLGGGDVYIYKGILKDVELRTISNDKRVHAAVQVKVKTSIPMFNNPTVKGTVYTDAWSKTPSYSVDMAYSEQMQSGAKGDATAKDTYGLAIDTWMRTNYPGAILTLEGSVKYRTERATGLDDEKNTVELYTIVVSDIEVDVYKKNDAWYNANTHEAISEEDLGDQSPKEKMNKVIDGYEGENRVWEDWRELLAGGYIEKDATTQGAGSCFVFYADTPTEQTKIMELLEAFYVAFVDENGDLLATAQLNLDNAYANQGKVTVPLEVVTGTDYTDESGFEHTGITTLTQNEPILITALIYLNGSKLENGNVLASGELQGQLNIQFGTSTTLLAPDNEELQSQARTITATVTVNGESTTNGTIGGSEGLTYKESGYPATVTLNVQGEQPERISGFFVRAINATQGTRGEEVNFVPNEDGTWTGNFTLKNPGTYIFNTLLVDGVQYTLHDGSEQKGPNEYYPSNRPKVYIQGLSLLNASVDVAPGTYMIAENSKQFTVTANIYSAVEPRQVTAQFFSADNSKQYTAILTRSGDNWVGTANISSSDTYSLRYISVDGQTLDVPGMGSYTLYLGLSARISTTVLEKDRTYIYQGEPKQFTMRARVFDNAGTPIEKLNGVKLTYNNIISPAAMTWNDAGYYEGVLNATQPGFLTFLKLELGSAGTISSVENAPSFTAISMELPTFLSAEALPKQTVIKESSNPSITVLMQDAKTADVWGEMTKSVGATTETYYIKGEHDAQEGNKIVFTLPKEDGNWTLHKLLLQNVFDKDANDGAGQWYEVSTEQPNDENSYVIALDATQKKNTDVVANPIITLYYGVDANGKPIEKASNFTVSFGGENAAFMTPHTNEQLLVEIKDYIGRPIDSLNSVTWNITHDATTMLRFGGYTGEGQSLNSVILELQNGSDTVYAAATQEFRVAGRYASEIVIDLGTNGTKTTACVPSFTVRSKAPTVKIKDITMDGSSAYSVDLFETGSIADSVTSSGGCGGIGATNNFTTHASHLFASKNTQYISRIENDTTVWLYFKCSHEDIASYTDKNFKTYKTHTYNYNNGNGVPAVTMSISDMGYATKAKLTFAKSGGGDVVMITEYTADGSGGTYWGNYESYGTDSFVWTQNGDCKRFIGIMDNGAGSNGSDTKTVAGTITANAVVLSYGGKDYSFSIDTFTIHNPY